MTHLSRSQLLLKLIDVARASLAAERHDEQQKRREAILKTSGAYTEEFGADYLENLRTDWPS